MVTDSRLLTRTSSRVLPGHHFAPLAEADLRPDARRAIKELPSVELGVTALIEMPAPRGVPDMTVVVGDPAARNARLRLDVAPLLNQVDAGIVAAAWSSRPSTPRSIAKRLGWQIGTVERRIPILVNSGALRPTPNATFTRHRDLQPIGTIYAVELKLTAWKKALTQGRTYRTWADSYVLVMDRVPDRSLIELASAVRSDRAGLRVGGHWVVRPRRTTHQAARRLWTSEHVIAAWR